MFVTNWISTTKIQKISEITNFFRHYFLSRTEVVLSAKPRNVRILNYEVMAFLNFLKVIFLASDYGYKK